MRRSHGGEHRPQRRVPDEGLFARGGRGELRILEDDVSHAAVQPFRARRVRVRRRLRDARVPRGDEAEGRTGRGLRGVHDLGAVADHWEKQEVEVPPCDLKGLKEG